MITKPVIPEFITVHLGKPKDNAQNITIPFTDYIKNVASSEIYPTWPEESLKANILAITSYTLNRIYTEWYPSQGYNFDITSSTAFDQSYVKDRDIFDSISKIVDESFNNYIIKGENVEPYISKFCDGTTVKCDGLSQWGTVALAKEGKTALEILRNYYGKDINILENAPVRNIPDSYSGVPVKVGAAGNDVKYIQTQLNRISKNFPLIPYIPYVDAVFSTATENAVKAFQKQFNLSQDGIVGKATWYKIKNVYNGVKRLGELSTEGLSLTEVTPAFATVLKVGDKSKGVAVMQYYLATIATVDGTILVPEVDGIFGESTKEAVMEFQKKYGLPADGVVGRNTWNRLFVEYKKIVANSAIDRFIVPLFPGEVLKIGFTGPAVKTMQEYMNVLATRYPNIPTGGVDGIFGEKTRQQVIATQKQFKFPPDGNIGPILWDTIAKEYLKITTGDDRQTGQYLGEILEIE